MRDGTYGIGKDFFPGKLKNFTKQKDKLVITTDQGVILNLYIITDNIFRLRYANDGFFEKDFSYAIDKSFTGGYTKFEYEDKTDFLEVRTANLKCRIQKADLKITFKDMDDQVINEDELGYHWEENHEYGGNIVKVSKKVQPTEYYYGLGDKPTGLNLKGKRFTIWGSDVYGFEKEQDPLYKNIPFFIGLHDSTSYGIFFDNTFRTHFDFASERHAVSSFWADGGEMNYYFIYGPDINKVIARYSHLTGKPEMPPLWALGYHQCKWSYFPEKKVREIANKFRELEIPCDALYLDIDYMDEFRCFTWDKEKFPDPKGLVEELKQNGFKTVVIIDPGIKVDEEYSVFKEAFDNDYFCKRADGPFMKGKVWPGECYFPDFTNAEVRAWWANLFEELIGEIGIQGVWNDMNEPAVFEVENKSFPYDVRHDFDGHPCSHRKAHNVYGMQMARATYHGVKRFTHPNRPFLITRSLYSGTQRYSSAWTGDNLASWEHLWLANIQCQRMCMSGYSFVGTDIGGFIGQPTPELYVRWIQMATFHPFMRTHSSGDHGNQEPWSFGKESLKIVKQFIELRYELLPYLYTTFYQYISNGRPILRPLCTIEQYDIDTHYRMDEFMCGDHIMVCPIQEPNTRGRYLYLPKGLWYHYWDDRAHKGGEEFWEDADLKTMPIYIKAGAVIPKFPIQQYVGEKDFKNLDLHLYYIHGKSSSQLYEDRGDGYEYKRGIYALKRFNMTGNDLSFSLQHSINGEYNATYQHYRVIIHGMPFKPTRILIDNQEVEIELLSKSDNLYQIILDKNFGELEIKGS